VKPQARPAQSSDFDQSLSPSDLLQALSRGLLRSIGTAQAHLAQHREARAAQELHRHLSGLSDAELARRGLDREQLARLVAPRDRA
jgi:hypothetical protein